jgi:pimeloyl-ACP methyl ester carboxylesterase
VGSGRWRSGERGGISLSCLDHGGTGPSVLLLHGLAGYAREWDDTASWLSQTHRVVVPEQRGHGRSEHSPADVSPAAFVQDAEKWARELSLAPTVLVGQSLGGLTALLLAAERPDLVRGLVVVEATPEADPGASARLQAWLETWPVPFATRRDAAEFFGGDGGGPAAWAAGLEERQGGLWPSFDPEVLVTILAEASGRSYWEEWARVSCPALVVRGTRGWMSDDETRRMLEELPNARLAEIPEAGHDVHLEQPERWHAVLGGFLAMLDR